jgi:hypothetical protein
MAIVEMMHQAHVFFLVEWHSSRYDPSRLLHWCWNSTPIDLALS